MRFSFYVTFISVGASYTEQEDCKLPVLCYLKVVGGIGIVVDIIEISVQWFSSFRPDSHDSHTMRTNCFCINVLISIVLSIWGSVIIFGPYRKWDYADRENEYYCEYTPYMFAFVMLIIWWCTCLLLAVLRYCCEGTFSSNPASRTGNQYEAI